MATDEDLSYSDDAFEGEDKEDTDMLNSAETYNDYHQQILFYRNFDSVSGRSLQRPKVIKCRSLNMICYFRQEEDDGLSET